MPSTADRPQWFTLGEASRLLGVDASTLRTWADAGQVRTFRTPGGHRRFAQTDLQALLQRSHPQRPPQVARLIHRQGSSLVRTRPITGEEWYAALDDPERTRIRRTCRSLMHALTGYLSGGVRRREYLRDGERAGRALGEALAVLGLTPAQATGAFLHFHDVMTEAVTTKLSLPAPQQVRSLRQIDAFLNRVMLRMMEAFEERHLTS